MIFTEEIQPACLPSSLMPNGVAPFPSVGSKGYIAGWGLTKNFDIKSLPIFLQNAAINIYESTVCDDPDIGDLSLSQVCLGKQKLSLISHLKAG